MSIKVTDFKWKKGKNDLEYIALLEKNLDVMMDKFRECSKVAREQYKKGRADEQLQSIEDAKMHATEYLDALDKAKEEAYEQGKADGAREFAEWLSDSKYTYIEVGDIGFYTDDHQIHWRPIDNVLTEWQKGAIDIINQHLAEIEE